MIAQNFTLSFYFYYLYFYFLAFFSFLFFFFYFLLSPSTFYNFKEVFLDFSIFFIYLRSIPQIFIYLIKSLSSSSSSIPNAFLNFLRNFLFFKMSLLDPINAQLSFFAFRSCSLSLLLGSSSSSDDQILFGLRLLKFYTESSYESESSRSLFSIRLSSLSFKEKPLFDEA